MRDTAAPRSVPLMVGLSGFPVGVPPSGVGSTALTGLTAAPPPLNRTLGRLGTGSWMRFALERTSALLAGEQEARSSRQQENQQRRKVAHSAVGCAEEPTRDAQADIGSFTVLDEIHEGLPPQQQGKQKPKRSKRGRSGTEKDCGPEFPSGQQLLDSICTKEPSESHRESRGGEEPRRQGKKASKKLRKDAAASPAVPVEEPPPSQEVPAAAAADAAAADASADGPEQQLQQQQEAASREKSTGDLPPLAGRHSRGPTGIPEGVPSKKSRQHNRGTQRPSRPSAEKKRGSAGLEGKGLARVEHCRVSYEKEDSRGATPSEGSAFGDFSFVVGIIGGLAVPASASPAVAAPDKKEEQQQQQQEEQQERPRKLPKASRRRKAEDERTANASHGRPKDSRARAPSTASRDSQAAPVIPEQQQQQRWRHQQQKEEERERRHPERRRRRSDGERHRRSGREIPLHGGPVDATLEPPEAPLGECALGGVEGHPPASPPRPPGTSVGVQAGITSCFFFPSVWAADFSAARQKANAAERQELLRLLGGSEGDPLREATEGAPASDSASTGGGALLRQLWLPAAVAAWEAGNSKGAPGGNKGASLDDEGPSSSSESPSSVASPLRGPRGPPVLRPRYVSFGDSASCSLFATGEGPSPAAAATPAGASGAPEVPLGIGGPNGAPTGDAARLVRALRRTHRRLVLGGQSAVLRSDSSSEDEASSREPSPSPDADVPAAEQTPAAAGAAAAGAAAPWIGVQAKVGVLCEATSGEGCLLKGPVLQEEAAPMPPAAATTAAGTRSRRPRCSAPPAVGFRGGPWGLSTDGSGSDCEEEKETPQLGGSTSSSSNSKMPAEHTAANATPPAPVEVFKVAIPRSSREPHSGPIEAAVTPGVQHSCEAGVFAAEAADVPTPLVMEAPTISNRWGPPEMPAQQQQPQQQQGEDEVECPSVSAATQELLPDVAEGVPSGPEAASPHYRLLKETPQRESPPTNLLSSPAREGRGASEEVTLGALSLEGSPIGRPLEEATEEGGSQEQGPLSDFDREDAISQAEETEQTPQDAKGDSAEGSPSVWGGLVVEGDEMVLSDEGGPEAGEWDTLRSVDSPLIVSIPDSEADSLSKTASPTLPLLQKQPQGGFPGETNENLPLQHQVQYSDQHEVGLMKEDALSLVRTAKKPLFAQIEEETPEPATATARNRSASALWFRNLGEIGLEGHRPAADPRISRCGVFSPGEAALHITQGLFR